MKIGKLVQKYIPAIFDYCEKNPEELECLMNLQKSRDLFRINFPFCIEVEQINPKNRVRFWKKEYKVCGKTVRVTSQWFEYSRPLFLKYLSDKGILSEGDIKEIPPPDKQDSNLILAGGGGRRNARYRSYALGNAQNVFIRNILGNLGDESFSEKSWGNVKKSFGSQCAYCGEDGKLTIDHATPINKEHLGEHRLGNLVPACEKCNNEKGSKDYTEFLIGQQGRMEKIEEHMRRNEYVPLKEMNNFDDLREILEGAYEELKPLADRYVKILNIMSNCKKSG